MKKKGFTLIELLAVIVLLAIIMVIAVPKIIDVIENGRRSAAKSSAELYVEAIEYKTALGSLNSQKYPDKDLYAYDEIKVDIRGEGPTSGIYSLKNSKVVSGNFCVNGYEVVFENRKATVLDKCPEDGIKLSGSVKLSSSSGNYTYPDPGTFEVTENLSGGTLSCTSSNEEVATCSISGTTVTVTPGNPNSEQGYAELTVKSAATNKYKEAKAVHVVTTKGLLSYTSNGYSGTYDGKEHGITVECGNATITYGTTSGTYNLTESPKYIDVGTYTVYYKIEKEGYIPVTGSQTVVINRAKPTVKAPTAKTLSYTGNSQALINAGSTTGGTIQYKLNTDSYSTSIPSAINAGTYTVYYKVVGNNNYEDVTEKSISVTISKINGNLTLSSSSGEIYTRKSTNITVSNATGGLSCSSSSTSVATCSVSGTTVTINGITAGTATITVKSASNTNYKEASKTYTATIKQSTLSTSAKLGDYIKMTPTSTSYSISSSLTGYTNGAQTINPSELNLWRVIRINSDGTIEMVSQNTSSNVVCLYGKTGFLKGVGTLNTIAAQYVNSKYTTGSRCMGYNGQTATITNTSKITSSAPWTSSTSNNNNEIYGGGDMLYTTDTGLVTNAIGNTIASPQAAYWLASRYYDYIGTTNWRFGVRFACGGGLCTGDSLYAFVNSADNGGYVEVAMCWGIRPIVTLKSGLTPTGSGTSSDPYVLP